MANGKKVLVTGATGQQGGGAARGLLAKGFAVRAMTRNPGSEKAAALGKLGAEVVKGDLDDRPSLEGAVKDVWGVFAVQNTWEAGVEGEEKQGEAHCRGGKERRCPALRLRVGGIGGP